MSMSDQEREIQQWMEDVAQRRPTKRKLIFDKKTKRLVTVTEQDPRADESVEFTPQEARRFAASGWIQ